jgi:hypothetical protein
MRHQLAQRDRQAAFGHLEIQVLVDVRVQIQLAGLHQLHHRSPGHQLGDRGHPEQGAVRIHRGLFFHIRNAVTATDQDLAVLDHGHHRAGDVAACDGIRHEPIQPGGRVIRGQSGNGVHAGGRGLRGRGRRPLCIGLEGQQQPTTQRDKP